MIMRLAIVVALFLTSCGLYPDGPVVTECHPNKVGRVQIEFEADCVVLESNVSLARQLVVQNKLMTNEDFTWLLSVTPIRIHNTPSLDDSQVGVHTRGIFMFGGVPQDSWIELSRDGCDLLHELLHAWQGDHYVYTADHQDWESNGYEAVAQQYENQSSPLYTAP
jgi:hypothetical protein